MPLCFFSSILRFLEASNGFAFFRGLGFSAALRIGATSRPTASSLIILINQNAGTSAEA